ncbi:MAG: hypothetical protein QNJ12_16750 [Ilumatobacter sp.]|uniref:hypothetical protein n=1 Tax=Ilumatobacter sp. TaxID=1967498 RepID=UPI00260348A2|nr:hypothetical protein [Ilumatobacter sp.]MDJ0770447.1 hypothetical protein [Ilumatobacter sp.]
MSEIDDLARRAVDGVTTIAAKARRFAGRLLIATVVVCGGGFLLGVAALSNGIQSVWIVLGIVFGAIAIGGSFIAWWRVGSVKRHVPELVEEVRALVDQGQDTGRTVVETFVVGDEQHGESAIVLSRSMYGFRNAVGGGLESSARLTAAITALTSFPGLVIGAILISLVFAFLGFIFLIALAL